MFEVNAVDLGALAWLSAGFGFWLSTYASTPRRVRAELALWGKITGLFVIVVLWPVFAWHRYRFPHFWQLGV